MPRSTSNRTIQTRRRRAKIQAGAASARLKGAIDSGRTGDKVPGFDPAAAPLGTDAESAGSTSASEAAPASGPPPSASNFAADPAVTGRAAYQRQDRLVWFAIIALIMLVVLAIVWFRR